MSAKATARASCRLARALEEVLADVRGNKPLPIVAVIPGSVDVCAVRRRTGLSHAAYTARFGIARHMLQDWEQCRDGPDPMARVLLQVIAREPEAVLRALAVGR